MTRTIFCDGLLLCCTPSTSLANDVLRAAMSVGRKRSVLGRR
jgi:hypothetical protein